MEQNQRGGTQKIQEYLARIKAGESKESILQELPPSFVTAIEAELGAPESRQEEAVGQETEPSVPPQYKGLDADTLEFIWTIPEYMDEEKTKSEKERKQKVVDALRKQESAETTKKETRLADEIKVEQLRKDLGVGSNEAVEGKQQALASLEHNEDTKNHLLSGLVKYVSEGRMKPVVDLYEKLYADVDNPESRKKLASGLFQDIYNKYRIAEYPHDPDEENIWDNALKSTKVAVDNNKNGWMYRGIFPKSGEETVTRGSFNVNVTPELINKLDDMIASGKIRANYKFGQPGTQASPTERHDSISIYFLEQPSDEALKELSATIQPFVRGDNLFGKKVEDGFFMSEIGSIETKHIESLIQELKTKDPAFAEAVKIYASPRPEPGKSTALKMSEAQFYAIKDVARAFGYDMSYDKDAGFTVL